MFKYRVTFETEVQVDGWTDFRDREFEKRRESITVIAKNIKAARKVALKNARGYHAPGWGHGHDCRWFDSDIKKVARVKKK